MDFRKRNYSDVSGRVLGNAESGVIFTPTLGFVHVHLPAGDSNLRHFFLLTRLKLRKNTLRRQGESKFGYRHKRSEDRS